MLHQFEQFISQFKALSTTILFFWRSLNMFDKIWYPWHQCYHDIRAYCYHFQRSAVKWIFGNLAKKPCDAMLFMLWRFPPETAAPNSFNMEWRGESIYSLCFDLHGFCVAEIIMKTASSDLFFKVITWMASTYNVRDPVLILHPEIDTRAQSV